ncbi:MAG: ATP-binding cassette domain-containing protein [Thermoplasmata archaeon]|jgi:tungstate transport system ATP-binding protein|nr:ATP-binding cassette domain-containing protein [Thermoplasmata archaeon]
MTEAVALKGVSKHYKDVVALKDVSLSTAEGEVLGIVGPSGAGKSTMLRIMDLIEPPTKGDLFIGGTRMTFAGRKADQARRALGMVLQKPVVLNRSVANNLAYALMIRGWDEEKAAKRVDEELRRLGLLGRRKKNARTLSGGEMQRLCFARATIHEPRVLLLDEFAANLDPTNVALLEQQVRDYMAQDRARTVVMVTHNMFQAKRMCDRVVLMWGGEVVEAADRKEFFENPKDPRTAAFVNGESVY